MRNNKNSHSSHYFNELQLGKSTKTQEHLKVEFRIPGARGCEGGGIQMKDFNQEGPPIEKVREIGGNYHPNNLLAELETL